ncbi:methyltransferase family protein [Mesocricetibacter intestinalis]|uniref:Methyltransferase family protein n=1 Tax=Mesocricetibacter intestinalis TaxID=1521930 RepID=A0A4R6VAM5_9PAST|nr:class I SAM-dependent methyltransferase [Mesocricetibacter intestinalis]TDQ56301.1 methyltransferase family protein [Mesocricetibacter intestinalis]
MSKQEAGHNFLARLGKTRLRPGGRKATDWLIAKADFNADKKVLEVACNMGTTAIELAKRFGCRIEGVDLDETALIKARANISAEGLSERIHVQRANALKLPFEDNSFHIVVNEAMLTMLPLAAKMKAIAEYYRVLKPNGLLLTHDIMLLTEDNEAMLNQLRAAINISVSPLTRRDWEKAFYEAGFCWVESFSGQMSLLSPQGMIYDEGVLGSIKIVRNALKAENRQTFAKMFRLFNHSQNKLNFIAVCSRK